MKICKTCKIEKNFTEFHKDKKNKDNCYFECKECRKKKSKIIYQKLKNSTKINKSGKTCYNCLIYKSIDSFHKHNSTKDGYRAMCKECCSKNFSDNYHLISESHKKRSKEWRIKNKDKYNLFFKKRYKTHTHIYVWRGMLSSVLRRMGKSKENSTYELLGYSAEELKKHIENLFTENMSWDNWGEWHIDHIRPISSFDKNCDPKIVNALCNLQPLWRSENISKGNKYYG